MLLLLLPLAPHLDHQLGMVLSVPPVQLQAQVMVYAYRSLLVGVVLLVPSVQELQMLQLEVDLAWAYLAMLLLLLPLALHLDHELGMVLSGPSVQELQVQVLEVALVYA